VQGLTRIHFAVLAFGLVGLLTLPAPAAFGQRRSGDPAVFEGPVPRANCGPGSRPETGLQGQVPLADRQSGRSSQGYWCNLELVGRYGAAEGGPATPRT
jgi:hypothetical protein